MTAALKHGDFTGLAKDYAAYRPGYSPFITDLLASLIGGGAPAADVGAGTGIWSRQLARAGFKLTAVEPNDEMRKFGEAANAETAIAWRKGSAEQTGLADASCRLLSMASSFHWTDFDAAIAEFDRVLTKDGYFLALWNPRAVERSPLLAEIEAELRRIVPTLKRVSSGRSEFCDKLHDRLLACGRFRDVVYLDGFHIERQSRERYLGLWRSVNDIRVQAGPERFDRFLRYVEGATADLAQIDATYQTRAWLARK